MNHTSRGSKETLALLKLRTPLARIIRGIAISWKKTYFVAMVDETDLPVCREI